MSAPGICIQTEGVSGVWAINLAAVCVKAESDVCLQTVGLFGVWVCLETDFL